MTSCQELVKSLIADLEQWLEEWREPAHLRDDRNPFIGGAAKEHERIARLQGVAYDGTSEMEGTTKMTEPTITDAEGPTMSEPSPEAVQTKFEEACKLHGSERADGSDLHLLDKIRARETATALARYQERIDLSRDFMAKVRRPIEKHPSNFPDEALDAYDALKEALND